MRELLVRQHAVQSGGRRSGLHTSHLDDDDHDDALDRPFELSHIVAHRTVCGALRARRQSTAPPFAFALSLRGGNAGAPRRAGALPVGALHSQTVTLTLELPRPPPPPTLDRTFETPPDVGSGRTARRCKALDEISPPPSSHSPSPRGAGVAFRPHCTC